MHNCQNLACIQNRQKTANFIAAGLLDYNPLSEAIKISEHLFQNHLLCLRYPNRSKLDEQYFCIRDLIDLIRKIVFGAFANGQIEHSHVDLPNGGTRTYTIFMATFSQPVGSFIGTLSTVHGGPVPTRLYQYTAKAVFANQRFFNCFSFGPGWETRLALQYQHHPEYPYPVGHGYTC